MNITCVICSELFVSGADIYFTQCGHVFHYHCLISWLERSKSCPQCRNRVTEKTIHKAYFNISNAEQAQDAAILLHKLDNANFSISLKEKEIKTINEKKYKLKQQNKSLREEVARLENNDRTMESTMHAFKDQIVYFKSKAKDTDRLSDEIIKLKSTIRNMENVEAVLKASREQVNNILRDEHNVESLALLAATLKKALLDSEKKVREIDFSLKKLKNEYRKLKKDYDLLQTQNADSRRELQQLKIKNEKERNILKQRLKGASINNIIVANPEAGSPKLTTSISELNMSNLETSTNASLKEQDHSLSTSLTVVERVENIVNSDSPYLPVKSNFGSFLDTKFQAPSDKPESSLNKEYSFLKKSQKVPEIKSGTKNDEVCYNGLGGSQREDIYPIPKGLKRNKSSSSISSRKFKKLAPNMNSKTTITQFVNLCE